MLLETHARPTVFPNEKPPPFIPAQRPAPTTQLPHPTYYQPQPAPPCQLPAPYGAHPWNQACNPPMAMYGAYGQGYPYPYMQANPYMQHAMMPRTVPPPMFHTMPYHQPTYTAPATPMPFPPAAPPVVATQAPAAAPVVFARPAAVAPAAKAPELPAATAPPPPTPTLPPAPSPKAPVSKRVAVAPSASKEPAAASSGAGGPIVAAPQRRRARAEGPGKQGWTVEEDQTILRVVEETGQKWSSIAAVLPGRTDDAVRNRFLRLSRKEARGEKRGDMWTAEEDKQIREAVQQHGLKWHEIAVELPGRSANAVRNRYLRCMSAAAAKSDAAPAAPPAAPPAAAATASSPSSSSSSGT